MTNSQTPNSKILVKNIFAAVFEKSILDPLLKVLDSKKVKFWATEGTVKYLKAKGFNAKSVVSGFDFDGRVKSIDRVTFARILADTTKKSHLEELRKLEVEPIDLVIVDLYPLDRENFPESMDIGGQALIRAAVKNYQNVVLAFDTESINELVLQLSENNNFTTLDFRKKQAAKAAKFIAHRCGQEAVLFSKR